MKKQFRQDRAEEITRLASQIDNELLTEERIAALPIAIQRHFRLCGFVGKPPGMNADIIWKESFLKLKPTQRWKEVETLQFNSVNPIMRTAYMRVKRMFFAGKDLYKNGQGTMKGKILNLFTVIDAKGKEITQSSLITSFCEMMLLSGYAFQDYIRWQEIDDRTVEAHLCDNDINVSGVFHFDTEGKFHYFKTTDRYFDNGNGQFDKKPFTATVHSYIKTSDGYQPKEVSVSWILDDFEFEYFKGEIQRVDYNPTC